MLIFKIASSLPGAQHELVTHLVDTVNEHQAHLPSSVSFKFYGSWTGLITHSFLVYI